MPSFAEFGNDLYSGRRSIDFVGRRRTWYLIATVAILISFAGLGIRGLNLGIEFRGGSEFRVSKAATQDEFKGIDAVKSVVPGANPLVSKIGTDTVRVQTDRLSDTQVEPVRRAVAKAYGTPVDQVSTSFVGPTWGQDVSDRALQGLVVFLVAVGIVIALYFRTWKMAVSAIVALAHDLILTVGVYAIVGFEVTPATVIGFLTILGYSLYDTVVVFDKVRENTASITTTTKHTYPEAANLAVNQTLVRSINTSIVALLPVGSILFIGAFLLGAGTLKDLSLALFVGIAAGTYSSIFIATPLLADLRGGEPELVAQAERVRRKRAESSVSEAASAPSDDAEFAVVGADAEPATTERGTAGSTGAAGVDARGQRQQPRRSGGNRPGGRRR